MTILWVAKNPSEQGSAHGWLTDRVLVDRRCGLGRAETVVESWPTHTHRGVRRWGAGAPTRRCPATRVRR